MNADDGAYDYDRERERRGEGGVIRILLFYPGDVIRRPRPSPRPSVGGGGGNPHLHYISSSPPLRIHPAAAASADHIREGKKESHPSYPISFHLSLRAISASLPLSSACPS